MSDALLDQLARALNGPDREPRPERVEALRAHLAATSTGPASRSPRRALHLVAAAVAVLVGFAAGVVVSDELPRPVRAVAHAVGLPVDSNELVDARRELRTLGEALAAGDAAAIQRADAEMVRLVKTLDAAERAKIEPVAHEVHLRAVEFLGQLD